MKDSYFVCATPRTGSSLLLGLLESTGVAGQPQAYFRPPDRTAWAHRWHLPGRHTDEDFARAALAAGRSGNGVFGAKLMWGSPDLASFPWEVFGRTGFVLLHRDDVVAQAVSWVRAEQTQQWFLGGRGEISGGTPLPAAAPRYDAAAVRERVAAIEEHQRAWEAWFAARGIEPHRVTYEDLTADMSGTVHAILRYLSTGPPHQEPVAYHRRQSDHLNQEWADRYRTSEGRPTRNR